MTKNNKSDEDQINCKTITDEEIEEWIVTTRKVLIVLNDEDQDSYNRIYQDFMLDLQNLKESGRITDEDYEDILESL